MSEPPKMTVYITQQEGSKDSKSSKSARHHLRNETNPDAVNAKNNNTAISSGDKASREREDSNSSSMINPTKYTSPVTAIFPRRDPVQNRATNEGESDTGNSGTYTKCTSAIISVIGALFV